MKSRIKFVSMIVVIIAILIVIFSKVFGSNIKQKEIITNTYSVKYDSTWKVNSYNDNELNLTHKDSKSKINFVIKDLTTNMYGKTVSQIASNIKENLLESYSNYNCIYEGIDYWNDNIGESYKYLLESGQEQAQIVVGIHGYKIVIMGYSAENKYFDILLDSASTIAENFNIIDKVAEISEAEEIELTGLNFKSDNKDYSDANTYEEYFSRYYVQYTIPKEYIIRNFYAVSYSKCDNDDKSAIGISKRSDNILSLVKDKIEELNDKNYENIEVDKLTVNGYEGYYIKTSMKNLETEFVYAYYSLDNFNTIEISITGKNITRNLIDNIKLVDYKPCGSYIDRKVKDGYLNGNLNENSLSKLGSDNYIYSYVNLDYKVPEKYTEVPIIYGDQSYKQSRQFKLGRKRNKEIEVSDYDTYDFYDYNITLSLSSVGMVSRLDEGDVFTSQVTYNGITYNYYTGKENSEGTIIKTAKFIAEYTNKNGEIFTYEIYVTSLDDISTSLLQDFTSVKIEEISLQ